MMSRRSLPHPKKRRHGFSLLELMATIALMTLLASFAIPAYMGYIEDARATTVIADLGRISVEIERYVTNNNGEYPETLAEIGADAMEDPWGNRYEYLRIAGEVGASGKVGKDKVRKDKNLKPLNTDFDLYSRGEDGDTKAALTAKASRDDILRANNGAFFGLADDY